VLTLYFNTDLKKIDVSNGSCNIVSVVNQASYSGRVGNSDNKNNIILLRIHMKTSLLANKRGDERIILIAVLERLL
jgi:hypothetical protein